MAPRSRTTGSSDVPPGTVAAHGRFRLAVIALLIATLLAACTSSGEDPQPTPSGSPEPPRPFTVMTTDRIRAVDPAAITDAGSSSIALNVFQRLMTAEPGQNVLKPDAAKDCIVETPKTYVCTLKEDLQFHNGHKLTSSDVKFSIERATRLAVPGWHSVARS